MRFADLDVDLGVLLVVAWVVVAVVRWRRPPRPVPLLVATGAAALLFTAQAVVVDAVADPGPLARLDAPVLADLVAVRSAPATAAMATVSALGGTAGMTVLVALTAGVLWWRGRQRDAAVAVAAGVGAGGLVVVSKDLWARARPPEALHLVPVSDYSLPSGHSLESVVVLGMLGVLAWRSTRSPLLRVSAVAVAAVPVAVIGLSRLYLGVHWFTDVLTGWLLGAAWLALCAGLLASATPDGATRSPDVVLPRPRPGDRPPRRSPSVPD